MKNVPVVPPRFFGLTAGQAAAALIVVATLARLFSCAWLPILPDEAYYFQWSRHLDASYFSKGPAVAYTIAAGTALFGDTPFGVRFFAVMLAAGTAWQIFLLARRWYDETAALVAVLLAGVVPLYAVGAVIMTIDPLSAFFWVWAANLFSRAVREDRLSDWLLAGFAVGSGFLAKYLNALELLAFLVFLLLVASRRRLLVQRGFWSMVGVFLVCIVPVLWWNGRHHWASAAQLGSRGHLQETFHFSLSTFASFFGAQAVVVSPLLFFTLLAMAVFSAITLWEKRTSPENEGELLLLLLFSCVFLFYAFLALHLRCEPNWPAVSYLSLLVILAGHWREILALRPKRLFLATAFCVACVETVLLHGTWLLPLPARLDPLGRTVGWSSVAQRIDELRRQQHADILLTDGYKEASVFSFELSGKPPVYPLPHWPPANQFDFWPSFPTDPPHRALWITGDGQPAELAGRFASVVPLESVTVWFRGVPFRVYRVYLCENPPQP